MPNLEKPMLFSTLMVKAILADIKKMTRRLNGLKEINKDPDMWIFRQITIDDPGYLMAWFEHKESYQIVKVKCPWKFSDILWVRETWCNINKPEYEPEYYYLADCLQPWVEDYNPSEWKWKPSIFMPREACRLFLKVTNVRVERLQEITEVESIDEGAFNIPNTPEYQKAFNEAVKAGGKPPLGETPRQRFRRLWDSLNAERGYGWDVNPWVFVISFERMKNYG